MHGGIRLAVDANARAVDLGQAVDVVELDAELIGDAPAHLLSPALGADDALAQLDLIANAALGNLLGQQQRIRTRSAQNRAFKVLHHLELLFRVARPHGDGHSAQTLAAGLEADAGGPQAVARRDLDAVLGRHSGILIAARELDGPVLDVLFRIRNDDRGPRRATGGVDADDLLLRHGAQPKRVRLAQIRLVGEGEFLEIFLRRDGVDIDAREFLRIETVRNGNELLQLCLDYVELLFSHLHGE